MGTEGLRSKILKLVTFLGSSFSIASGVYIFQTQLREPIVWAIILTLVGVIGVLFSIVWFFGRRYYSGYDQSLSGVRERLSILHDALRSYRPELIIAFNRSGAVVAGMLAVNLRDINNEEDKGPPVIVLNRCLKYSPQRIAEFFEVGSIVKQLEIDEIRCKKVLLTFMLIDGGHTLDAGFAYLERQGIKPRDQMKEGKLRIATLYINPTTRARIQKGYGNDSIVWAHETPAGRAALDQAPWLLHPGGYPHDTVPKP